MLWEKHIFWKKFEVDGPLVEKDSAEFKTLRDVIDRGMQQKRSTQSQLNDCAPCNQSDRESETTVLVKYYPKCGSVQEHLAQR